MVSLSYFRVTKGFDRHDGDGPGKRGESEFCFSLECNAGFTSGPTAKNSKAFRGINTRHRFPAG